ncbi:hypothetical protein C1645_827597 [Glomus cerebriforme]|uniref:Uncharacterized protein n=1 Tax=Glomus cerebriforme TaxID=658196 RepID=A0A397SSL6_9GLOM|nr:hypothetical protein C1645_827597 [Glomus cerebriforme]
MLPGLSIKRSENITAGSVIYQGIEDNLWISQNELKSIIERAVVFVKNQYDRGSSRHITLLKILPEVFVSELIRKDPLANQVISDDSNLVQKLPERLRESFMKPVEDIVPSSFSRIIWEKCKEFVVSFVKSNISILPQNLSHNGRWKESDKELANITLRILAILKGLSLGRSSYVNTAECQSSASADRKGEG